MRSALAGLARQHSADPPRHPSAAAGYSSLDIQSAFRWAPVEAPQAYEASSSEAYGGWITRAETASAAAEPDAAPRSAATPARLLNPRPHGKSRAPHRAPPAVTNGRAARLWHRRMGCSLYLAERARLRLEFGRTTPTPPKAARDARGPDAGSCSTDPYVPVGKYAYGTEVIEFMPRGRASPPPPPLPPPAPPGDAQPTTPWNGAAVPCAIFDDRNLGKGLAYVGDSYLARGDLIGLYLADTLVPTGVLRDWMATNPLAGEYAVASCGWALIDTAGRSFISRINEGARPNVEIAEVDINPTLDEPSYTVMAAFALEAIAPVSALLTDYGPDYNAVREARGYHRPYDAAQTTHPRVQWLDIDGETLERTITDALDPDQMHAAKAWGGVLSHRGDAGNHLDPNARRGRRSAAARAPRTVKRPRQAAAARAPAPATPPASQDHTAPATDDGPYQTAAVYCRHTCGFHAVGCCGATWRAGRFTNATNSCKGTTIACRSCGHRECAGGVCASDDRHADSHTTPAAGRLGATYRELDYNISCSARWVAWQHHRSRLNEVHTQLLTRAAWAARPPTDLNRPDHRSQRTGAHVHARLRWAGQGPAPPGMSTIDLPAGRTYLHTSGPVPRMSGLDGALPRGHPPASDADIVLPYPLFEGRFALHITMATTEPDGSIRQALASIQAFIPLDATCSVRRAPHCTRTVQLTWAGDEGAARWILTNPRPAPTALLDGDLICLGGSFLRGGCFLGCTREPPARAAARLKWAFRLDMPAAVSYSSLRPPPRRMLSRKNARCFHGDTPHPPDPDGDASRDPPPQRAAQDPPAPDAGCSSDPFVPVGKYTYGTEVIEHLGVHTKAPRRPARLPKATTPRPRAAARGDARATAPRAGTRRNCAHCGQHGTVPAPPRTLGGCLCGGGFCSACAVDTCACPWYDGQASPPVPSLASMQRNESTFGYVELPIDDPYAPTILCMGDASGAMARACQARFPSEICVTVDYRTRRRADAPHCGLHWCGDVRDILWRQRWRIVISHPDCAFAALSNTTGKDARIASGDLWWGLAFAVMLYCAPADVAIVEQPDSLLAKAYRAPDAAMQYLDYGVGFSKLWCIWRRGGAGSFNPAAPTTLGAAAWKKATHRLRHRDRDEQARIRSATPPAMATALCATINLTRGAFGRQPLYREEVERLADGYRRITGHEPPAGYDEATADAHAPPARSRHLLAGLPLAQRPLGAGAPAAPVSGRTSGPAPRAQPTRRGAPPDTSAPHGSGEATPAALRSAL